MAKNAKSEALEKKKGKHEHDFKSGKCVCGVKKGFKGKSAGDLEKAEESKEKEEEKE